jgi:hypothetical protein
MAQPVWVTPSGNLGTIPEGQFYQIPLRAYNPAEPVDPDSVKFLIIAGALPRGVQLTKNGLISGVAQAIASLQGVPSEVPRTVTSKFAVRAYTEKVINGVILTDRIADRTFEISVSGEDRPEFITPAGNVGTFIDGQEVSIQIQAIDGDPSDFKFIRLAAGALPPGLTISPGGLISGYIVPNVPVDAQAGYSRDNQGFSTYPFDFTPISTQLNYQFQLEVTDGKESDLRTYEILVYNRNAMTADNTVLTSDNTFITADISILTTPFIVNAEPTGLGTYRSDNFFAYQFIGKDFDGDTFEFIEYQPDGSTSALPPGLVLDLQTGWLYGYIPNLGAVENSYQFGIIIRKAGRPDIFSDPYFFNMILTGAVSSEVVWITSSDLGEINNGSTSILKVEAVNPGKRSLQYRLKPGNYPEPDSGVYNKLPQGLSLLSDGTIAGRVSFNTFALDGGTTTFDSKRATRLSVEPTTFDMVFTFTVNAYSVDGLVNVYKTFSLRLIREYNEPYENLYIKAMPPQNDRNLISGLLQNQDVIPQAFVYRASDPNFGVANSVNYKHAYGLTSSTYEEYMQSLVINHYWKNLTLGAIETAQATDAFGNVIYEVVYARVIDDQVNSQGESVSKSITLPYSTTVDGEIVNTVYPNSLINMRDQVIDVVGQISKTLPLWMLSKQANGSVLGFTPAWVICYTNPGRSKQIVYNIQQTYGNKLNTIDFEVDRYELDRLLSIHWDPTADSVNASWVPTPAATTFDISISDVTTFDANSLQFIAPVDNYTNTDAYDKYLVFPRRNILV